LAKGGENGGGPTAVGAAKGGATVRGQFVLKARTFSGMGRKKAKSVGVNVLGSVVGGAGVSAGKHKRKRKKNIGKE